MAVLKYVTRGEQTAQGKQKAYFCAHPDDYGRYFEKISNEILNTLEKENNRNCAFFYLENANAERDDDFKFSFKEMNLIVMPVTTRLLTTKNPALDIEFRLAIENHIPILPIMTESKLDELFSSKCGDLKFIGKYLHKDEVISYEETLTRFLTSILISDELAEKIKRSREICDNPEDNYHIGLACLSGIDVPKDEERALALITSAAEAGLTDAVKKLVSVYRYGDGAERDRNKATEWQKKLVDSRKETFAEKQDEGSALGYLCDLLTLGDLLLELKQTDEAEEIYDEMLSESKDIHEIFNTERTHRCISDAYCRLGDARKALDDVECAEVYYLKAAGILEIIARKSNTVDSLRALSDIYNVLSVMRYSHEDYSAAEKHCLKHAEIAEAIERQSGSIEDRSDLSIIFCNLGSIRRNRGDLEEANKYFLKALEISESIYSATYIDKIRRNRSIVYKDVGDIRAKHNDLNNAEKYYLKALEIRRDIERKNSTIESKRDLAIICRSLGDIRSRFDDCDGAEKYYLKALELSEAIATETGTADARRELAAICKNVGDIYASCSDFDSAEHYLLKAFELRESLAKEVDTLKEKRKLLPICNSLGDYYYFCDDLDTAKHYYIKSLEIQKLIAHKTETVEDYINLALSYYRISYLYRSDKTEYLKKSLEIMSRISNVNRKDRELTKAKRSIKRELVIAQISLFFSKIFAIRNK